MRIRKPVLQLTFVELTRNSYSQITTIIVILQDVVDADIHLRLLKAVAGIAAASFIISNFTRFVLRLSGNAAQTGTL